MTSEAQQSRSVSQRVLRGFGVLTVATSSFVAPAAVPEKTPTANSLVHRDAVMPVAIAATEESRRERRGSGGLKSTTNLLRFLLPTAGTSTGVDSRRSVPAVIKQPSRGRGKTDR